MNKVILSNLEKKAKLTVPPSDSFYYDTYSSEASYFLYKNVEFFERKHYWSISYYKGLTIDSLGLDIPYKYCVNDDVKVTSVYKAFDSVDRILELAKVQKVMNELMK